MFVLLMTIVVPNRLVQIESNELDFELKIPTKPFVLTQFNKMGGVIKKMFITLQHRNKIKFNT